MTPKRRPGFSFLQRAHKGSQVSFVKSIVAAGIFGAGFILIVYIAGKITLFEGMREVILDRGFIQYLNIALGAWAYAILLLKRNEIREQQALTKRLKTHLKLEGEFDLATVKNDLRETFPMAVSSWLFQRIDRIDAYLQAAGSTKGLRETLREQSDRDAEAVDVGYSILRVLIAVIPLVGFSGTVLGISASVGYFSGIIQIAKELEEVTRQLGGVTNGLAVAYDTTLLSLLIVIPLMIGVSSTKKRDDEFLNEIDEYCEYYIVDPLQNMDKREMDFSRLMLQISDETVNKHSQALAQHTQSLRQLKEQHEAHQASLQRTLTEYQAVGDALLQVAAKQEIWSNQLQVTERITSNFEVLFSAIKELPNALGKIVSTAQETQLRALDINMQNLQQTIQAKDTESSITLKQYLSDDQKVKSQLMDTLQQIQKSLAELRSPLENLNKPVTVTLSRPSLAE